CRPDSIELQDDSDSHIQVVLPFIQKGRAETRITGYKIPHLAANGERAEHVQIDSAAEIEHKRGVRSISGVWSPVDIGVALGKAAQADAADRVGRKTAAGKRLQFQSGRKKQCGIGARQKEVVRFD